MFKRKEFAVLKYTTLGHLAQLVRALHSHCKGHWFKSSNAHQIKPCSGRREKRIIKPAFLYERRTYLTFIIRYRHC